MLRVDHAATLTIDLPTSTSISPQAISRASDSQHDVEATPIGALGACIEQPTVIEVTALSHRVQTSSKACDI